jgi:hypothetical protein
VPFGELPRREVDDCGVTLACLPTDSGRPLDLPPTIRVVVHPPQRPSDGFLPMLGIPASGCLSGLLGVLLVVLAAAFPTALRVVPVPLGVTFALTVLAVDRHSLRACVRLMERVQRQNAIATGAAPKVWVIGLIDRLVLGGDPLRRPVPPSTPTP